MDYKFWVPLVVSIYSTYLNRKQVRLMNPGEAHTARTVPERIKSHWPLLTMALLVILVWAPYVYDHYHGGVSPSNPSPARISQTSVRVHKDVADHTILVTTTVDGSDTADKYGKDNYIFVFCLTGNARIEPGEDDAIDRSKPFDLGQRTVNIEVPLGPENTARILKAGAIDIYLLMIPKSMDESVFATFDELYAHGARLLDHTAMVEPPKYLEEEYESAK